MQHKYIQDKLAVACVMVVAFQFVLSKLYVHVQVNSAKQSSLLLLKCNLLTEKEWIHVNLTLLMVLLSG